MGRSMVGDNIRLAGRGGQEPRAQRPLHDIMRPRIISSIAPRRPIELLAPLLLLLGFVGRVLVGAIPATGLPAVGDRTSNARKRDDFQGPLGSRNHGAVRECRRSGSAAFTAPSASARGASKRLRKQRAKSQRIGSGAAAAVAPDALAASRPRLALQRTGEEEFPIDDDEASDAGHLAVMLRISYDGRAFTGWSAENDPNQTRQNPQGSDEDPPVPQPPTTVGGTRRRRTTRSGIDSDSPSRVRSVQGEIVPCLARLYGNRQEEGVAVVLDSCSRTDKGVHSTSGGMVALAYAYQQSRSPQPTLLPLPMPPSRIVYALNRMLPADVRIHSVAAVRRTATAPNKLSNNTIASNDYDGLTLPPSLAMNDSSTDRTRPPVKLRHVITNIRKTYWYQFSTGPYHDPMTRKTCWHVTPTSRNNGAPPTGMSSPSAPAVDSVEDVSGDDGTSDTDGARINARIAAHELDAASMRRACRFLEGTHDFRAFQAGPRESERRNPHTVCTVDSIDLAVTAVGQGGLGKGGCQYSLEVTGDRFLYKMVRMMVGCVVAVGQGRIDPRHVEQTAEEGTSRDAWPEFPCAPAHGLALVNVQYETQPGWDVSWL